MKSLFTLRKHPEGIMTTPMFQEIGRLDHIHELARIKFVNDFKMVMKEQGVSLGLLAERIGIPKAQLRSMLHKKDLTFSDMVILIDKIGGEYRPLIVVSGSTSRT